MNLFLFLFIKNYSSNFCLMNCEYNEILYANYLEFLDNYITSIQFVYLHCTNVTFPSFITHHMLCSLWYELGPSQLNAYTHTFLCVWVVTRGVGGVNVCSCMCMFVWQWVFNCVWCNNVYYMQGYVYLSVSLCAHLCVACLSLCVHICVWLVCLCMCTSVCLHVCDDCMCVGVHGHSHEINCMLNDQWPLHWIVLTGSTVYKCCHLTLCNSKIYSHQYT